MTVSRVKRESTSRRFKAYVDQNTDLRLRNLVSWLDTNLSIQVSESVAVRFALKLVDDALASDLGKVDRADVIKRIQTAIIGE